MVFLVPSAGANNHFFDHPMTFSEVCAPLKLSESIRFFFQPRHIEYALGVKTVAEVTRARERVELSPGKNVNSYDHIFSRIAWRARVGHS